jgi:hypothetical protein
MAQTFNAKVSKKDRNSILIEISKENFEAFCDTVGLYKKEFLELLDASEQDHRKGRVTKRKSLKELVS